MPQKVCYLLTSPEKFQQELGNGSCNMDSVGNTGRRSSDGVKEIAALLLPVALPSDFPWDDTLEPPQLRENKMRRHYDSLENGLLTGTVTLMPMFLDGTQTEEKPSSLKTLFPPTK